MSNIKKKVDKAIDKIREADRKATAAIQKANSVVKKAKKFGKAGYQAYTGNLVGAFKTITGSGDYKINSNSLANIGGAVDSVPSFRRMGSTVRVSHREYLGEVIASGTAGAFSITSYPVNPGLFQTFPWFNAFANQFDMWVPHGIVFCFKTESSEFGGGTASLGTVVMASDYDPVDAVYNSKVEMENSDFACSSVCSQNLIHPIECNVNQRPMKALYTRNTGLGTSDARFYDLCNFQIATAGCTASQVVGELWMSFDITLMRSQVFAGVTGKANLAFQTVLNTVTNAAPLGATWSVFVAGSTLYPNLITFASATQSITFSRALIGMTIKLTYIINGTAAVIAKPTYTGSNGLVVGPIFLGGANSLNLPADGVSSPTFVSVQTWSITDAGDGTSPKLVFGAATLPTAISYSLLFIDQVSPSY